MKVSGQPLDAVMIQGHEQGRKGERDRQQATEEPEATGNGDGPPGVGEVQHSRQFQQLTDPGAINILAPGSCQAPGRQSKKILAPGSCQAPGRQSKKERKRCTRRAISAV